MSRQPQTYATHRRLHPVFHLVVMPLLITNLIVATVVTVQHPSLATGWGIAVSLGLVLFALCARDMALRVQDRVIRLEMRLRLAQVLPKGQADSIAQLTPGQLVALRFAGDAELPQLVQRTIAGEFRSNDAIKKAITDWQPDFLRA
ncbi:MAG: hypothetical protein H0V44_11740 [Planctomycetes bacterium]|nr:hypothetical protein [Planctomycetota bacterium]